jgi:hypothetical protein
MLELIIQNPQPLVSCPDSNDRNDILLSTTVFRHQLNYF